jgi:hypothetical protein
VKALSQTLTEHWDGTSWSVISCSDTGNFNVLFAATALSDGTVAAVGNQTDFAGHTFGIVLQNAAPAPKTPTKAAVATTALLAPLDAAAVDQVLAAIGPVDPPFLFAGHRARAPNRANGDRVALPEDGLLWYRA